MIEVYSARRRYRGDSIRESLAAACYAKWCQRSTTDRRDIWRRLYLAIGGTKPGFWWRIGKVFG